MSTRARWQSQNTQPPPAFYYTNFPATENPISEGGRWTNGLATGLDWQNVRTAAGSPNKAYASVNATGYDDSIAILSGFPANQSAQATVYLDPTYTAPDSHEIELLLRFQISANSARGYEVDFWFGGTTIQVVKWNGAIGSFDTGLPQSGSGPGGLVTGDVIKATMIGNTINVYKNGSLVWTCTDSSAYASGNPGMGFFPRTGCTPDRYCISDFRASAE